MPFSGPSSYLPTLDEFIAHWTAVNADLSPGNITLPGTYNLAALEADREALSDAVTDVVEAINDLEGHRTDRDNSKAAIRERMRQLGGAIRGLLAGSTYVGRVPDLIPFDASQGRWLVAMRDLRHIWTDINATPPAGFTGPLTLTGGYVVATFTTDTNALETTFSSLTESEQIVENLLRARDEIYQAVRAQLVRYREAVSGMFPAGHALLESLPRIEPLPGHTPDPVVLSGEWDEGKLEASLSWTASTDPDLASYSVRRSGATPYDGSTETVVASVLPGVLSLDTSAGLGTPGSTMGFKVYVVLSTGNERGSNAVTITHPLGPIPPP